MTADVGDVAVAGAPDAGRLGAARRRRPPGGRRPRAAAPGRRGARHRAGPPGDVRRHVGAGRRRAVRGRLAVPRVRHRGAPRVGRPAGRPARRRVGATPGHRLPVLGGDDLRTFLASGPRRLFLTTLLASYTRVASGSTWVHTARGWRRRRFSELDPVRLASLLEVVPPRSDPGSTAASATWRCSSPACSRTTRRATASAPSPRDACGAPAASLPDRTVEDGTHHAVGFGRPARTPRRALVPLACRTADDPMPIVAEVAEQFDLARRVLNFMTDRYLFPVRDNWFGGSARSALVSSAAGSAGWDAAPPGHRSGRWNSRRTPQLDTSQVADARGSRRMSGGTIALGGGGLGIVGVIVAVLFAVLGGGSGGGLRQRPRPDRPGRRLDGHHRRSRRRRAAPGPTPTAQRGLPDRRRGQQRAALLEGRRSTRRASSTSWPTRSCSPPRPTPAAAPRPPPSAPSTARPTRRCTSTSASSTTSAPPSAPTGGTFAQAYVVAHEYGHHAQHLLGTDQQVGGDRGGPAERFGATRAAGRLLRRRLGRPRRGRRPDQIAHRRRHRRRPRRRRRRRRRPDPAAAQGRVDPETWTHGSAAQRQQWFTHGVPDRQPDGVRHVLGHPLRHCSPSAAAWAAAFRCWPRRVPRV